MQIIHKSSDHKGSFDAVVDNETPGTMTYTWAGTDRIIIDHTEVSEALKGQGAGKKMLEQAVLFAREKKIRIIPLCPFAKATFQKTPEWHDVL